MDYMIFTCLVLSLVSGFAHAQHLAINVSETAVAGTVLWNSSVHSNCSVNRTIPALAGYVSVGKGGADLFLLKPLDLEVPGAFPDANFTIYVTCAVGGNTQVDINIIPVNEFTPIFLQPPFNISIPENKPKNIGIFSLKDRVIDHDAILYHTVVSFDVHPYIIIPLDGRPYFDVDNETGEVSTKTKLDYESLERHAFTLNITVSDDGGKVSAPVDLNVFIEDDDDMPPVFLKSPNCYHGYCRVENYHRIIDIHFEGVLDDILPSNIYARDNDLGINERINYTLQGHGDDDLDGNLDIDQMTGEVTVLVPYANFTNITSDTLDEPFFVNVTIVATEISANQRTANASFTLVVYRVLPTPPPQTTTPSSTMPPPITTQSNATMTSDDESSSNSLLLVEILVPCIISVICLLIVLICVLVKRQKLKENKYKVKEKERETRNAPQGDMMDSLPATMATPYDLVGAYANLNLNSYDKPGTGEDYAEDGLDVDKLNNAINFDGLYAKVKMRAPRQTKMRAVDIVEADYDDAEDDDERDGGDELVAQTKQEENQSNEVHANVNDSANMEGGTEIDLVCHSDDDEDDHN